MAEEVNDVRGEKIRQGTGKGKERGKKSKKQTVLKTAKGTRDYDHFDMAIREHAFKIIEDIFKLHGAGTIDTPVFELKDTLTNKYGEDAKLIYDIADQGGEICALRYDLTVPFARYIASNKVRQLKRYQIGRVYRRDQPMMNRGRYREFYQCDFDIAGEYDEMLPDAEVISVMVDCLSALDIGRFEVNISHRMLLDGILNVCGVPQDKVRSICSAVDKLDKMTWEKVKEEMVKEKGVEEEVADKIHDYIVKSSNDIKGLVEELRKDEKLIGNESTKKALDQMETLADLLSALDISGHVVFDLSLARGLDYYTGVIMEAVLKEGGTNLGSIAGGGRYDELVGMFSGKPVPCVGFSVGIERVLTILQAKMKKEKTFRPCPTEVVVASIDKGLLRKRLEILAELRKAGIRSETLLKVNTRIKPQMAFADTNEVPFAIIIGSQEVEKDTVQVKDLVEKTQEEVTRSALISYLIKRLRK